MKDVVTTDFGSATGQPEHMANSPLWAMDNAIWCAGYGTRFKLRGGVWQKDSGLGRGQWGLCQDDAGRLYFNYNSDMLRADLLPTEAFTKNPLLRNATSINAKLAADQTLYPAHPTPGVNRGYDAKTLSADGRLTKPTGTCGALIYRGDAFPAAYRGNAFVPEPCANLVKRFTMSESGGQLKATNTAKGAEFLRSTDERFRPVNACDGPDGALYLVDMYRGIIQHKGFLTHYLIANIKDRKLEQPVNMGRIWRVVPEGSTAKPVKAAKDVQLLTHANGWVRDTTQRLIVESGDVSTVPALKQMLQNENALARLHALWTLDGLAALTPDLLRSLLNDKDTHVRAAAVRLAPRDMAADLAALTTEAQPLVLAHLAIKLTSFSLPEADTAVAKLLANHGKEALVREGALTGLRGKEAAFAKLMAAQLTKTNGAQIAPVMESLASLVAQAGKAGAFEELLALAAAQPQAGAMQVATIKGLATRGDPKSKTPPKLLWLEAAPASLATLKAAMSDKASSKLFASVDARLVWPGKPGAPKPPVIKPLSETQVALFEKGKTIYSTLCAACHQPHGFGLDGPRTAARRQRVGAGQTRGAGPHRDARPRWSSEGQWSHLQPRHAAAAQLTDEDIAGVITYIRREWEHTASAVETKAVTKIRAENQGRLMMWTEKELKDLGKKPNQASN